jgi:hypothetical protein
VDGTEVEYLDIRRTGYANFLGLTQGLPEQETEVRPDDETNDRTKLGLYALNDILHQEHHVEGIYRRRNEAVFGVKIGRALVFGMH